VSDGEWVTFIQASKILGVRLGYVLRWITESSDIKPFRVSPDGVRSEFFLRGGLKTEVIDEHGGITDFASGRSIGHLVLPRSNVNQHKFARDHELNSMNAKGSPRRISNDDPKGATTFNVKTPRRDLLTPLIERAQFGLHNKFDAPSVWAKLTDMAKAKRSPLIGITESGIQWINGKDEPRNFSLKCLRERLRRAKKM
jgi:hypothetical protein